MKTLKYFSVFIVTALLFSSCVVKSLHAFYTKDILYYEQKLVGNWLDKDKGNWIISPFKEVILKENHKVSVSELDAEQSSIYQKYKDGYVVFYEKDSTKSTFLAMPFKIKDQIFLDFTPIEDKESDKSNNDFYKMHLINVHSLAKLDLVSNDNVNIKWFDSDKIEALLQDNKIKIKYEKVGFDETTLLTASSEELVKFIEKYMGSEDEDKWKTRTEVDLKRI